jgi:mannosyltransferase
MPTEKTSGLPDPIEVIAPNLKRRLSGVTATILHLVPRQARFIGIVTTGPGLPDYLPHIALARIPFLPRRVRVWHARRNSDLLVGVVLKRLFKVDLRMIFTSSSPRARSKWTRWLIGHCSALVATSARNGAVMPPHIPTVVIPHGIDTGTFSPQPPGYFGLPDQRLIGCFGRIRQKKGTLDLVQALISVLPEHPSWGAVIMGRVTPAEEQFAASLRAQIKEAGLETRIHIRPEASLGQMPAAYSDLALYVAPSHYEGFGLTPVEAMACGVPVLATKGVGTFDDQVLEQVTGLLVPPSDPAALAAALIAMLSDSEWLAKMASASRAHIVENFAIDGEVAALNTLYQDLLGAK